MSYGKCGMKPRLTPPIIPGAHARESSETCGLCGARMVQTANGLQCVEFVGHKQELAQRRLGDDPSDFMATKKKS